MKKLVKTAIIITIITVLLLAILNSCARIKSYDYQPVVSYESNSSQIAEINTVKDYNDGNNLGSFGSILRYEQIILVSSIILVVVFTIIFFNLAPKKRG